MSLYSIVCTYYAVSKISNKLEFSKLMRRHGHFPYLGGGWEEGFGSLEFGIFIIIFG
jgi:hypothetical protein